MPAVLLVLAIAAEVVGTIALRQSAGLTRLVPAVIVVIGYVLAFVLLGKALEHLSLSLAYAIWSGVGTALIAVIAVVAFGESVTTLKVASIGLIVLGVVGLNLAGGAHS